MRWFKKNDRYGMGNPKSESLLLFSLLISGKDVRKRHVLFLCFTERKAALKHGEEKSSFIPIYKL